jgi:hypothetical protein
MEEVLLNLPVQLPHWDAAINGRMDWEKTYRGYASAVDWPTAGFFRELNEQYPHAKFILTHRSPESWVRSFSETIYKLISYHESAPPQMQPWLEMSRRVIAKTGFPEGLDAAGLMREFELHNAAVKATIPADRLLVFEVQQGWAPLCAFLGVPVPSAPFPRTNHLSEFWDKVSAGMNGTHR